MWNDDCIQEGDVYPTKELLKKKATTHMFIKMVLGE
jgi:hypothetical protein